jgi:AcrR family transcriptional regulator
VGITGPAVYRHFPNKYAMLVHATRELTDAILAATRPAPGPVEDPAAGLDRMLATLAGLGVERRRVGGLYQWEGRYLTAEHRAEFRAELAVLVGRIADPLRRLRPALPPERARLLARAVLSVTGSLSTHRAPITRGRAEHVLRRTGWALLRADLPAPAPATGPTGEGGGRVRVRARREILMAEALRLFYEQGYHRVSMRDIGRAAGINASSVYRHFPGKGELLAAVYYRAADRVAAATATALATASSHSDALDRLLESYVDLVFGHGDLVCVYQAENNNLPDSDRHELRKAQRLHIEEWVRLLRKVSPRLTAAEARIQVHAATNLVTDLGRLSNFDRGGGLDLVAARLAHAVLRQSAP